MNQASLQLHVMRIVSNNVSRLVFLSLPSRSPPSLSLSPSLSFTQALPHPYPSAYSPSWPSAPQRAMLVSSLFPLFLFAASFRSPPLPLSLSPSPIHSLLFPWARESFARRTAFLFCQLSFGNGIHRLLAIAEADEKLQTSRYYTDWVSTTGPGHFWILVVYLQHTAWLKLLNET